jgi:hypothetical protein
MAISNLTGQKTYQSFRNLMQISSSGQVYDGLGNLVTFLQLTSSFTSGSAGGSGAGFPFSGSAVITGSLTVSSSLIVTGSTISTEGFTGSLEGTASFAVSSSYTISSSYSITSSYSQVALSASYSSTSSYSDNFTILTSLTIDGTLTKSAIVTSTIVGANTLFQQPVSTYTSAFGKYTTYNASTNSRAGEFIVSWNGTTVTYTDISTADVGDTSTITFTALRVGGDIQINAVAGTSAWTVKMIATFF